MGVTGAIIIGAALGAGASVYSGEKAAQGQKKALRAQEQAQRQAIGDAVSQRRASEEQMRKANQKTPDINAIMADAMSRSSSGVSGTRLSGSGLGQQSLGLGRTRLLGE
jgi:uncharacterized protein HemX